MPNNLREALFPQGVNQWELAQLLLNHFHSARELPNNEIAYGDKDTEFAIKLLYKDEVLHDVIGGNLLTDADVSTLRSRIATDLLGSHPPHIAHQVMFAHVPVEGWFRYKDVFQITPMPPEAPRPQFLFGEHPFLLSFSYPGCPDMVVRSVRQVQVIRELELICFTLLVHMVGSTQRSVRFHWTLNPENSVPPGPSRFLQEGYVWQGDALANREFPETSHGAPLVADDSGKYYSLFAISTDQRFSVPTSFEQLLDAFYSLDRGTQEQFLRACFWLKHAHDVFHYSQSAMYMSLIGAIEALLPEARGGTRCSQCGHYAGISTKQQFAEFVERYVPGTGFTQTQKKEFYSIRSSLSHGGSLLMQDKRGWGGMNPRGIEEDRKVRTMQQIVRIALVNWLGSTAGL